VWQKHCNTDSLTSPINMLLAFTVLKSFEEFFKVELVVTKGDETA